MLLIVQAPWLVREVESYAPSKFQCPTTLGDPQNVEKTIRKKFDFFGLGNPLIFMDFGGATPEWMSKPASASNFVPDRFILHHSLARWSVDGFHTRANFVCGRLSYTYEIRTRTNPYAYEIRTRTKNVDGPSLSQTIVIYGPSYKAM